MGGGIWFGGGAVEEGGGYGVGGGVDGVAFCLVDEFWDGGSDEVVVVGAGDAGGSGDFAVVGGWWGLFSDWVDCGDDGADGGGGFVSGDFVWIFAAAGGGGVGDVGFGGGIRVDSHERDDVSVVGVTGGVTGVVV
ncbi:MAG: hypothetical protein RI897_2212 [Verrucomicrobiota bacterium]